MEVIHLNQKQLATRWQISESTLERWGTEGIDPKFLKLLGRVICRLVEIEAFEESCLSTVQAVHDAFIGALCEAAKQAHDGFEVGNAGKSEDAFQHGVVAGIGNKKPAVAID